jgi:hypothetical protein
MLPASRDLAGRHASSIKIRRRAHCFAGPLGVPVGSACTAADRSADSIARRFRAAPARRWSGRLSRTDIGDGL